MWETVAHPVTYVYMGKSYQKDYKKLALRFRPGSDSELVYEKLIKDVVGAARSSLVAGYGSKGGLGAGVAEVARNRGSCSRQQMRERGSQIVNHVLSRLDARQLRDRCKGRGLPTCGSKEAMVLRLLASMRGS